jgi:hypothetical protein
MQENLEIKPMKGINDLKFGVSTDEVKEFFGEPEEVEEVTDNEEYSTVIWHYWTKGLSIFFDDENNKLFSSVEVDNPLAVLWGKLVFQMNEKELIKLFKEQGYSEIDTENHEWGEKRVSFDDAMVDLYFEDGALQSINYGVIFNDLEIAVWPN